MDNAFARKLLRTRSAIPENLKIYRDQLAAFKAKFGRDMGPDDPFFFDPDAATPQFRSPDHATVAVDLLAQLMVDAGVDPEAIYAFKKTRGLFPSDREHMSPRDLEEWNEAVRDYHAKLRRSATQ